MFLLVLLEISSEVDALHQRLFPNIAGYRHSRPKYINHPLPNIISTSSNFMAGIAEALAAWTKIDVPSAIKIQKLNVHILQNISTVSIFFSGVSATTLQYSGQLKSSAFATPFNFLWLLSLLLSTGGAIQCQLAIYWHTSRHRRDPRETPQQLVTVAACELPLALLGASSVAFMIGLAFFTFTASSDASFLAIGITLAICMVGCAMIVCFLWLVRERNLGIQKPLLSTRCCP